MTQHTFRQINHKHKYGGIKSSFILNEEERMLEEEMMRETAIDQKILEKEKFERMMSENNAYL